MGTKVDLAGSRWTYLGLIDDKVSEYPWSEPVNAAYLDGILRRSALFEEPILLNDGYLLHYDWARDELLNPESLLRRLISDQRVIVFSRHREGRLDKMVEDMRATVKAYDFLCGRKDWSQGRDGKRPMRELLEEVSTGQDYHYATWPDMSAFDNRQGFDAIINVLTGRAFIEMALASVTGEDFEKIVENYRRLRDKEPSRGARTVWEETAKAFSGGDQSRLAELMWLGNEVYHYNMALAVAGTTDTRISVSTFAANRICTAFAREAPPIDVSCNLPHRISSMAPNEFVSLVRDVSPQRSTFRSRLLNHLQSPNEARLSSALEDYANAIGEVCSRGFNDQRVNVPAAMVGTALAVGGTVLAASGVGVGLLGAAAGIATFLTSGTLPHFVAGWHGRWVSRQFKRNAARRFTPSTVPRTGTFELKTEAARDHLRGSRA